VGVLIPEPRTYREGRCVTVNAYLLAEWSRTVPVTHFQVQVVPFGIGFTTGWDLGVPNQNMTISNQPMVSINLCCSDCGIR